MRKRVQPIEHGTSSYLKNLDAVKKEAESDCIKMVRALEVGSGPSRRAGCSMDAPDPLTPNRSGYITMKEDMRYKETTNKSLANIRNELQRFQSKVQAEVDNKLTIALENMRRSYQTPANNPCSMSPVSTEASNTIDELNEQVFESHKRRPSADDALARTFQDFKVNRARQVALDNGPNIWSERSIYFPPIPTEATHAAFRGLDHDVQDAATLPLPICSGAVVRQRDVEHTSSVLSACNNLWSSPKLYISPLSSSGTSSKPTTSKGKGHVILKENSSVSSHSTLPPWSSTLLLGGNIFNRDDWCLGIVDEVPSTSHVATVRDVRDSNTGRSALSSGDTTVKQRGAESNSSMSSADTEDVWAIPKQCISSSPNSIPLTQVVTETQSSVLNHLSSSPHISVSLSEITRQDEWYIENDESPSTIPFDTVSSNEDSAVFTAELSASKTMTLLTNLINLKVELDEMRANASYDMTILNCDYKEDITDNGSSSSSSEDDEVPIDVECESTVLGSGQVTECVMVEDNSLASVLVSTYSILILFYVQLWSPLLALGRRDDGVYSERILVRGTRHVV